MSESTTNKDDQPEINFTKEEAEALENFQDLILSIKDKFDGIMEDYDSLNIHNYDFDSLNKMYESALSKAQQVQPNHVLFYNKKK